MFSNLEKNLSIRVYINVERVKSIISIIYPPHTKIKRSIYLGIPSYSGRARAFCYYRPLQSSKRRSAEFQLRTPRAKRKREEKKRGEASQRNPHESPRRRSLQSRARSSVFEALKVSNTHTQIILERLFHIRIYT